MKLVHAIGGVLLASVTALTLAAAPAEAGGNKSGWCPPGLAKKGACVPPGLQRGGGGGDGYREGYEAGYRDAVRHQWRRGDYIPETVVYQRVYYNDYNLPRPQPGYSYVTIGGDLYLMAEATRKVIEAINLFDRATR